MIPQERQTTLRALAQKYGTPLYVYDLDKVRAQYEKLFDFITYPDLRIFYAMKANYGTAVLKALQKAGASIDAVSPAEILLAKKLGFRSDRILFTANNMTDAEMHLVQSQEVLFNIDSISRLKRYGEAYPGSRVVLRFNPEVVAGEHEKIQTGGDLTKFGLLFSDLSKIQNTIKEYGLKVVGLHEHTGSGIRDEDKVYQSMKNLLKVANKENFPDLEFVDFGGGFGVPYAPGDKKIDYEAFGQQITEIFTQHCQKYGKELQLYFEPGKYLVAESGYLVLEVNTIKNNNGRLIAGTDAGFPQLIRPTLYDAYHEITNLSKSTGRTLLFDIAGNICETGDLFAKDRMIKEITEGDLLAIENAGAYCYAMGGNYNLRPMPTEVVIENGKDRLTRKARTPQELVQTIIEESED
ncbi:diaminopimelate decarboxylase [Candidatus Woesearchaeota archaeon]|nr:diaminopimelate decarboxylase [Candidatus Woesearchaeota archaeon]